MNEISHACHDYIVVEVKQFQMHHTADISKLFECYISQKGNQTLTLKKPRASSLLFQCF